MQSITLILQSILLGIGLAMDAFSVSIANGLCHPKMPSSNMLWIAFIFAFFQFLMPMLGWVMIHTLLEMFEVIQPWIPYIAFIILVSIGIHMILENRTQTECDENSQKELTIPVLIIQGIATSIDALSAGLTFSSHSFGNALLACILIGIVTFVICLVGVVLGKRYGMKYAQHAGTLGGTILILIAVKILFF